MSSPGYKRTIKFEKAFVKDCLDNYSEVRDHLALRLIGIRNNESLLDEIPNMRREDMAVTVYRLPPEGMFPYGSPYVTNRDLKWWGTDIKTLFADALRGSMRRLPPVFRNMRDLISEYMDDDCSEMYVLTNDCTVYGASTVLYPNLLEAIAERLGKNFYLLPSSIHEMIILPDTGEEPMTLKEIVTEINRTELRPDEVLTDSVYYFGEGDATFYRVC